MSQTVRLRYIEKMRANQPIPSPDGPTLLPCQSETLNRYDDERWASNEVTSLATRISYLTIIRRLGLQFRKPYRDITKADYMIYFSQPVTISTKNTRQIVIKRFLRWLFDLPKRTYPDCISWLGKPSMQMSPVTAADLLTEEDMISMFRVASVQDRAIMGVLYDTAGRKHEIFYLRKKDVQKTTNGYNITLRTNPGSRTKSGTRTVPLVKSRVYLTNWLNEHPSWNSAVNPPLWVNSCTGVELRLETTFNIKLRNIAKKAGVTKRVYPHIFRHTKLTELARVNMPPASEKEFAGWSPITNMLARYTHLSGKQMHTEALRASGIKTPEEKPMFDKDKTCPSCGYENEIHATYCVLCSATLDNGEYMREEVEKIGEMLIEKEGMEDQLLDYLKKRADEKKKKAS